MIPAETGLRMRPYQQCPGSCLLIPAVGFWLSNWEVGVSSSPGMTFLQNHKHRHHISKAQGTWLSKIISSWLIHFVSLTEVFDNIIWFCSRWTGNTTTKYSSQKWNFLFSQKLEILRLWDTRFWTSLSTSSPMFWYSARTIVSAAPQWAHVLHTPFLNIYV